MQCLGMKGGRTTAKSSICALQGERVERRGSVGRGGGLLPDRKLIITRPLQGTTTTFSARQTWFACWPPYLHNPLAQLLK